MLYHSYLHIEGLLATDTSISSYAATTMRPPAAEAASTNTLAAMLQSMEEHRIRVSFTVAYGAAIYRQQMLVVLGSLLESGAGNFIAAMFARHPERMHDYVAPLGFPASRGLVPLKKVVSSPSREALLDDIAMIAMRHLYSRPFKDVVKRIVMLTKQSLPTEIVTKTVDLLERRHRAAHESTRVAVSQQDTEAAYADAYRFLQALSYIAKADDLLVDDEDEWTAMPVERIGSYLHGICRPTTK